MNTTIRLLALALLGLITTSVWADTGSRAALADPSLTLDEMLAYALADEQAAFAEYQAIQAKFGEQRPFSAIQASETNHIAWVKDLYASYGKTVPAASVTATAPATLRGSVEAGIAAEVDNIAMYDKFLATPELALPAHKTLRATFELLKKASQNHLAAFQRQLSRY